MQKQIENFTSAASGEKRVSLPTDYPYRMILARFWVQLSDINEIVTDIKLTCDTDKFIPFNRKTQQLDAQALGMFGAGRIKHDIYTANEIANRIIFNKEPDCRPFLAEAALYDIIGITYQWSSELKLELSTHAGVADGTSRKITVSEAGHAPHATLPIPFGRMMNPEDWFNPKEFDKVELVLTQAVASAVCEIAAEQVRAQA